MSSFILFICVFQNSKAHHRLSKLFGIWHCLNLSIQRLLRSIPTIKKLGLFSLLQQERKLSRETVEHFNKRALERAARRVWLAKLFQGQNREVETISGLDAIKKQIMW